MHLKQTLKVTTFTAALLLYPLGLGAIAAEQGSKAGTTSGPAAGDPVKSAPAPTAGGAPGVAGQSVTESGPAKNNSDETGSTGLKKSGPAGVAGKPGNKSGHAVMPPKSEK